MINILMIKHYLCRKDNKKSARSLQIKKRNM